MADRGKSGGRGNPGNLVPMNRRTNEEQKRIATMGGQASGRARKKKADFRRVLTQILTMQVPDEQTRAQLEALGLEGDMQTLLNSTMVRKALEGNVKAAEYVAKYVAQSDKTELDDAEQAAKIDRTEAAAELDRVRADVLRTKASEGKAEENGKETDNNFLSALMGTAGDDWGDGDGT